MQAKKPAKPEEADYVAKGDCANSEIKTIKMKFHAYDEHKRFHIGTNIIKAFKNEEKCLRKDLWMARRPQDADDIDWKQGTEIHEQIISYLMTQSKDWVLEIGGNIGHNSILINSMLKNKSHHVVIEPDAKIAKHLGKNRELNKAKFEIYDKAISGSGDFKKENSWEYFKSQMRSKDPSHTEPKFNTIVADCEGCLAELLHENPSMLEGIHKIQVHHDWKSDEDYERFKRMMDERKFVMRLYIKKNDDNFSKKFGKVDKVEFDKDPIWMSAWFKKNHYSPEW